MIPFIKKDWLFWSFWLFWTSYLISGVSLIPFHPDETSILYQSRDFEILLTDPISLAWDPNLIDNYDQTYRLLNAPLPKYILGLSRAISGFTPVQVATDWNWSLSWDDNITAGALPSDSLLNAARLMNTLLFSASIIFIYFSAKHLGGVPAGMAAAVLLGTNALLLLHARRAMSEAALIFTVTLSLWVILRSRHRPWLTGLVVALAVTSKLSAAPLFLMGLIAVVWQPNKSTDQLKPKARNLLQYLSVFAITVYLLTPLLWRQPIRTGFAILEARLEFTQGQIDTLTKFGLEDQILSTPTERFAAILAHQYFTSPAFSDVGNYVENTAAQESIYLSIPGNNLLRGLFAGSLMLIFTILGIIWAFAFTSRRNPETRRAFLLLAAGTLVMTVALITTIPIPVQRYGLPLTPFLILWSALGFTLPFSTKSN